VLLVYAASQTSCVPFGEDAIPVVDFSAISSSEKRSALQAANQARCSCECGKTLAQCVAPWAAFSHEPSASMAVADAILESVTSLPTGGSP
jgi:hypothetical protein